MVLIVQPKKGNQLRGCLHPFKRWWILQNQVTLTNHHMLMWNTLIAWKEGHNLRL